MFSKLFINVTGRESGRAILCRLKAHHRSRVAACVFAALLLASGTAIADIYLPNLFPFFNSSGVEASYSAQGRLDVSGPFFQSLGTNGRSCGTCHTPDSAFGLSVANVQTRYLLTHGKDPLFSPIDGSTCPTGPVDNSLLVKSGLIRVGLDLSTSGSSIPQFTITAVEDPYGCAIAPKSSGQQEVSVYRRPLPSTNLKFLSAVMWDGRESVFPLNNEQSFSANLTADLTQQAFDATMGHAQAAHAPSADQLKKIVAFEMSLNSAQLADFRAGDLSRRAQGGPRFLSSQEYYPGINDSLGGDPEGDAFNANAFTLFSAFQNSRNEAQASIARGEQIFNTQPLTISNVPGLTTGDEQIMGTCSTCHDSPNVGDHSFPLPLDVGSSHSLEYETDPNIIAALEELHPPKVPVFELVCTQGPLAGNTYYTSDPGKALISGQCSDIGRIKGPVLRGLAARAPYFHNGSAANLQELVNFYDRRFQIGLTPLQMRDLIHFLQSL